MAVVINTTTDKNRLRQNVKAFVADRAKAWTLTGYTQKIAQEITDVSKLTPGDKMGINSAIENAIAYYHKTWISVKRLNSEEEKFLIEIVVQYLFSDKWNPAITIHQRSKLASEGMGIRNRVDEYAAKTGAVRRCRA